MTIDIKPEATPLAMGQDGVVRIGGTRVRLHG
jgi:hypothetical protein